MPRHKRSSSQFNLAFLDIMCCGFGAVVLLVLLINGDMLDTRRERVAELRSEVTRIEQEIKAGRDYLNSLRNSMAATEVEIDRIDALSRTIIDQEQLSRQRLAALSSQAENSNKLIDTLQEDLFELDEKSRRIDASQQQELARDSKVREFIGQGDRQYLTGLKLGGKRVLLLVDASASMLDEKIVNILIRRNLDERSQRRSEKWQRTIRTVEWLVANLPADSLVQIYSFNTKAKPLVAELKNKWVPAKDQKNLDRMIAALKQTTPKGGTSLVNSFSATSRMNPRPDNIFLLTDGLPTQGETSPKSSTVSGRERLRLFNRAITKLPRRVPVNTILFPMEGDPMAAVSFWKLAVESGGAFLTPTRDWP